MTSALKSEVSSLQQAEASSATEADNARGNLAKFHGEGAAAAVEEAEANYQSPSMIAIGADSQNVSILALLVNLLLSVACLKAPRFIEKIGLTKNGAVLLSLFNCFSWVLLFIFFLFFSHTVSPYVFGLLWLINLAPGVLLSVQRDNWMSSLIPGNFMGRYLGKRMAIKSTLYLASFCFLGILLDRSIQDSTVGFSLVFSTAILATFFNFILFATMKDTRHAKGVRPEDMSPGFGVKNFFSEVRQRKLSRFVAFTSLFSMTVSLCGPLYAVFILSELRFSYLLFTVILATEYLAKIISTPFWGRIADRYGNIHVLNIVSKVIPFVPICWLFWQAPGYLIFIQAISGLCWGGYDLCTQNYLFKMAPPEKKLRYIMYSKSLTLFSMAIGGVISVFLLKGVFSIGGSQVLSIFLISGLLRGAIAWYLVPRLVDFAVRPEPDTERQIARDELRVKIPAYRSAAYYRPGLWHNPGGVQERSFEPEPVKAAPIPVSATGIFRRREAWTDYLSEMALVPAPRTIDAPVIYPGLYHRAAAMREYVPAAAAKSPAARPVRRYSGQYKPQRKPVAA